MWFGSDFQADSVLVLTILIHGEAMMILKQGESLQVTDSYGQSWPHDQVTRDSDRYWQRCPGGRFLLVAKRQFRRFFCCKLGPPLKTENISQFQFIFTESVPRPIQSKSALSVCLSVCVFGCPLCVTFKHS